MSQNCNLSPQNPQFTEASSLFFFQVIIFKSKHKNRPPNSSLPPAGLLPVDRQTYTDRQTDRQTEASPLTLHHRHLTRPKRFQKPINKNWSKRYCNPIQTAKIANSFRNPRFTKPSKLSYFQVDISTEKITTQEPAAKISSPESFLPSSHPQPDTQTEEASP